MKYARIHAIGTDELDLAHGALANLMDQGLARRRMAGHESGGDLEVLLLCGFTGPKDALDTARVRRKILLHENVHAFVHRILEVRRAERCVRGQHRHVAWPQAIDRVPIGIEAQPDFV